MLEYNEFILEKLREIPFVQQGAIGDSPRKWSSDMGLIHNYQLPTETLNRRKVKEICLNEKDILKAYLIVMSWGGQGRGPGGKKAVQNAWQAKERIKENITRLKKERPSRAKAYDMFSGSNAIPGLGPAYFTKLLYFFGLDESMYIMDQWTTKPIILITDKNIIKHTDLGPSRTNSGKNYELFCLIIDDLCEVIGADSGDEVEQRLFSIGSIKRRPRGEFRQLVFDLWKTRGKLPRYKNELVNQLLREFNEAN